MAHVNSNSFYLDLKFVVVERKLIFCLKYCKVLCNQRNGTFFPTDTLEHISPLSPTPPPRVKRKRMSPPEAQAALNEIKRLIRSKDDDEDLIAKDENLRVKDADLNNTKKSNERPCSKQECPL